MESFIQHIEKINFTETYFLLTLFVTAITPTWWNIVARREYRTHFLTKLCGGAYPGCYFLAVLIFCSSAIRDYVFNVAIKNQPTFELLAGQEVLYLSYVLFATGCVLVGATYWQLGITGTYLGDYFGILMKERVTGFPFNVMSNPMYNGSTMIFLANALYAQSFVGVILAAFVFIVYRIALTFEEPFTGLIYSQRSSQQKRASKKVQ
eukprot:gene8931-10470_t